MNVIFMGTPEFAIPALQALIYSEHQILSVYTRAPKPAGRRKELMKSPVHIIAEEHHLDVQTPESLKNSDEVARLKAMNPDIIVVVAYGLILPSDVISIPKYGVINIHPSKLPRWRGAAPIERCIMAGDEETAVSIMQLDEGLDTGDVILEASFPVAENVTARELAISLGNEGASLLISAMEQISTGTAITRKQSEEGVTYASKISADEEKIDWNMSARLVNCKIRALSPKPGAYFIYNNTRVKIVSADYDLTPVDAVPGTVIDDKLTIACNPGVIRPKLVQRVGREMVYTEAFLRGFSIHVGSNLSSV